jgi:predicted HTH transcriptional regulator
MNKKELFELIKIGEGYTVEFKEKLNDSLGKEVCAFANASGGKIILGVSDNGDIKGIKLENHDISRIQDIARNMDPAFFVNIEKINVPVNVPVNVPERKKQIILLIKENNHITIKELSDNLNVNEKTIKRDLSYLKNKKLLKRIGPDKGGYWEIIR